MFIKVHNASKEVITRINVNHIIGYHKHVIRYKDEIIEVTRIVDFNGGEFIVMETPEEIDEMIKNVGGLDEN